MGLKLEKKRQLSTLLQSQRNLSLTIVTTTLLLSLQFVSFYNTAMIVETKIRWDTMKSFGPCPEDDFAVVLSCWRGFALDGGVLLIILLIIWNRCGSNCQRPLFCWNSNCHLRRWRRFLVESWSIIPANLHSNIYVYKYMNIMFTNAKNGRTLKFSHLFNVRMTIINIMIKKGTLPTEAAGMMTSLPSSLEKIS